MEPAFVADSVSIPPRIVDAHVHLFPPEVDSDRERYAAGDPFFAHLYGGPRARMVTVERLLDDMERDGVAEAVIVGWPWQRHDFCVEHNTWLMDVVRGSGGRLRGLASVSPADGPAAVRELGRCLDGGLAGVGELNAEGQRFRLDDDGVLALANAAADAGVPLMLHTNEPVGHEYAGKCNTDLGEVYSFIRAVPDLKLVLAHWGGGLPFYELMPEVRAVCGKVYYDSAASPLLYDHQVFRTVVEIVGAGRVIFGSDYPLVLDRKAIQEPGFRPFLEQVQSLGFAPNELRRILSGSADVVFGCSVTAS
jgi:hypothetical protein